MPATVLYDYLRSSAAYRVRSALNLLGLPFRPVPIDLVAGEQRGADNLARNPQGLVPTLEVDGIRLTQSIAILEYLDETRGAGWLPDDPASRARVRSVAFAVVMDIHPVCNLRVARHGVSLGAAMEGCCNNRLTRRFAAATGSRWPISVLCRRSTMRGAGGWT
jgi:maleylacetoacetate isomerase